MEWRDARRTQAVQRSPAHGRAQGDRRSGDHRLVRHRYHKLLVFMAYRWLRDRFRQPPLPALPHGANLTSHQGKGIMAEHSFLQVDLSIVFLLSVILIWFMIAFQLILTIA